MLHSKYLQIPRISKRSPARIGRQWVASLIFGATVVYASLGLVGAAFAAAPDDGLEKVRRKCCAEYGGTFSEVGGGCGALGTVERLNNYKQCVAKANRGVYKQPAVPPGYMKDPNHPGRVIPRP